MKDESGEDYAFAANRFHVVTLPSDVEDTLVLIGVGERSLRAA